LTEQAASMAQSKRGLEQNLQGERCVDNYHGLR
jgi:hypothetical protein